ncbi:MAG: EVE domain-containing protein [Moorea sp. SIO1F2]|uniref:EVE domain-containing protein n=1 Tax=unclassified Moorena TaxID=2683338 RepID=UPI0013B8236D|nr:MULTISPECIES: EVE domain-containing protein [unclassified Moorena]NEO05251.1 EVE domain-containing protein [Moorena sp. SIO3I8]NET83870.1 EVE domain-containing protein [Moorena sp. SIO1F2]
MNYWLMKSEPQVYSITDLEKEGKTIWDGVRNYQARNFLREMKEVDLAFFYHSNTKPPGIVGLMEIIKSEVVDPTQFDQTSRYYDPKSSVESPRWHTVVVQFVEVFTDLLELSTLKQEFSDQELWVTRRGNRLSVMPVSQTVAQKILGITQAKNPSQR